MFPKALAKCDHVSVPLTETVSHQSSSSIVSFLWCLFLQDWLWLRLLQTCSVAVRILYLLVHQHGCQYRLANIVGQRVSLLVFMVNILMYNILVEYMALRSFPLSLSN